MPPAGRVRAGRRRSTVIEPPLPAPAERRVPPVRGPQIRLRLRVKLPHFGRRVASSSRHDLAGTSGPTPQHSRANRPHPCHAPRGLAARRPPHRPRHGPGRHVDHQPPRRPGPLRRRVRRRPAVVAPAGRQPPGLGRVGPRLLESVVGVVPVPAQPPEPRASPAPPPRGRRAGRRTAGGGGPCGPRGTSLGRGRPAVGRTTWAVSTGFDRAAGGRVSVGEVFWGRGGEGSGLHARGFGWHGHVPMPVPVWCGRPGCTY